MTNHPNHDSPGGRVDATPNPGLPRHGYSFPEGTVYAMIRPARSDRGFLVARLEITSHTAGTGGEVIGGLRIEDRRYTLTALHQSMAPRVDSLGVFTTWQCDGREHHSGCANGQGHHVEPNSREWTRLHDIARSTVGRFTSDVPGWQQESLRLHWLRERADVVIRIGHLNRMLSEADADLRHLDATLTRTATVTATASASASESPGRTRCVVLFCGGEGAWLVHARHRVLGFELTEPMCHGHAHRTDGSYDILSAEPISATTIETPETERS